MADKPNPAPEISENFVFPPLPSPQFYPRISKKKVLSIVGQNNHIIITKTLSPSQISGLIECNLQLVDFLKKDHYYEPSFFARLIGKFNYEMPQK